MSATFQVGIVGVGNMGGAMAQRLGSLGWAPWVHDLDAAKLEGLKPFGALAPADIQHAASNSVATIVCVVDAAQTRDVLFGPQGIAAHLQPGHVVLLCPTVAPEDVEAIAAQLAGFGVDAIDAPMSGGPARARDGSMSLLVAGADAVVARCEPLLQALSNKVFRISTRPGDGARTKLVNNLLAGINLVGAAEVLALARRMGLDLARTLNVIGQSSGQSWIGTDRMRRAITGDLAPRAHMSLLAKDTRLAQQAAQSVGFEGPLGPLAAQVFAAALDAGLADLDDAALLQFLERHPC
ncbi:NAD(P)-dependent oxidoreductase [Rhodoferax sp. AJA081-3]|uniref:NAD(P)-dependent oxidoreductase n=1 Tax=Rhodoferax sp. AJA081-3 TaxID=2752316 RepID=UPI001AE01105|nr:NAD(P)-dependent oxidoreductase [Rhodoferax sp. AJA081-3]QTN27368.1 NAD(P)-dependent oxidoreductase [Rhodoferax sp. AJA081-3]